MITRRRWLAGWGLLTATYLTLAVIHVADGGDLESAVVYTVTAAVTFGFAAAVLPIIVPRRSGGDDGSGGEGGSGGDEPSPPPWWPEFEREFRSYAREVSPPRASGRRSGARAP